jgi:hypothetical protein
VANNSAYNFIDLPGLHLLRNTKELISDAEAQYSLCYLKSIFRQNHATNLQFAVLMVEAGM